MYSKQRGITLIGWVILLVPIAIVGYGAIRLAPIYLNYMKVARSLEQTAKEHEGDESNSATTIRNTLDKHFDIESINFPTSQDIAVLRQGTSWHIKASYEDQAPFFGSVSLLVKFDKEVETK